MSPPKYPYPVTFEIRPPPDKAVGVPAPVPVPSENPFANTCLFPPGIQLKFKTLP